MNVKQYPELNEVETQSPELPSVSIVLPLHPFIHMEHSWKHKLKLVHDEIKQQLSTDYPHELVTILLKKYDDLIDQIGSPKHRKGVVMYLSPHFEKFFLLDFTPQEKIVIDLSYEIRDIVFNHALRRKALLLLMSANELKYYVYQDGLIEKVNPRIPLHIEAFMQDKIHPVEQYHEGSRKRELAMQLFIKNADDGLTELLSKYTFDVLVLGVEKLINHFLLYTKNNIHIKDLVTGNYFESSPSELIQLTEQSFLKIETKHQQDLMKIIQKSYNDRVLAIGLKNCWTQVMQENCKMLIIEKNFIKEAIQGADPETIYTDHVNDSQVKMKDAVDDLIEQAIRRGAVVEFVDDGLLKDYRHVAAVQYFTM